MVLTFQLFSTTILYTIAIVLLLLYAWTYFIHEKHLVELLVAGVLFGVIGIGYEIVTPISTGVIAQLIKGEAQTLLDIEQLRRIRTQPR